MKFKLEDRYQEDIYLSEGFFILLIIRYGETADAFPIKGLFAIVGIIHSLWLVWMPWRLERRLKKITHPDLAVQERLQSLRREKWVQSIIYGILWPMALAISVIYAR